MIKIHDAHPLNSLSKAEQKKAVKKAGNSAFDSMLDAAEESEDTPQSAPIMPSNPVGTMLALQEVNDESFTKQQAVKQGRMSLDALENIRNALLSGEITTHHISHLQHVVDQQREHVTDPVLKAVLDDIELRAAVELAKLERAQNA